MTIELALRPEGANAAAYDKRWQLYMDAVALKAIDRMPVALFGTFWLAKFGGISCRELMYNYEKVKDISTRAVLELDPTVTQSLPQIVSGPMLDAVDFKQLQWPGHGVGENQPFQYLDREYMTGDEYDAFLFDPTGFYLKTYLPRVGGAFGGLGQMPTLPGLHYMRLVTGMRGFAKPEVKEALLNLIRAGEVAEESFQHVTAWNNAIAALGYPRDPGITMVSPYDFVADYFRGARAMMTDLFRKKDKLLALLDKARIFLTRLTIELATASGHPTVFIPIHWAPDAFMSDKQFKEFYWPSFRQMMCELIDAGIIPMPLWEADCTKRLEVIADIPKGKAIYWFERTDMVKAYEVLGDTVCLRGNLSPSMMTTGTPDEVDAAVRHLVENIHGKGGHMILDAAFGLADETPVENAKAMFAAARKYAG